MKKKLKVVILEVSDWPKISTEIKSRLQELNLNILWEDEGVDYLEITIVGNKVKNVFALNHEDYSSSIDAMPKITLTYLKTLLDEQIKRKKQKAQAANRAKAEERPAWMEPVAPKPDPKYIALGDIQASDLPTVDEAYYPINLPRLGIKAFTKTELKGIVSQLPELVTERPIETVKKLPTTLNEAWSILNQSLPNHIRILSNGGLASSNHNSDIRRPMSFCQSYQAKAVLAYAALCQILAALNDSEVSTTKYHTHNYYSICWLRVSKKWDITLTENTFSRVSNILPIQRRENALHIIEHFPHLLHELYNIPKPE